MSESFVTVGKFHIDSKGAGRIYLKKKAVKAIEKIGIKHGDEVRIEISEDSARIVITKL